MLVCSLSKVVWSLARASRRDAARQPTVVIRALLLASNVHLADEPNSACKDPLTRIFSPRNRLGPVWLIYTSWRARAWQQSGQATLTPWEGIGNTEENEAGYRAEPTVLHERYYRVTIRLRAFMLAGPAYLRQLNGMHVLLVQLWRVHICRPGDYGASVPGALVLRWYATMVCYIRASPPL